VSGPAAGVRYWATRSAGALKGTLRNGMLGDPVPVRVNRHRAAADTTAATWPLDVPERQRLVEAGIWSDPRTVPHADVLEGRLDGCVLVGLAQWDITPFALLMQQAGGHHSESVRRSDGARYAVLSNGSDIHSVLLAALRKT
jgi:hypothetical protein